MAIPDNQPVLSSLLMDRSSPLGNSEDVFQRRALHVKIGNSLSEPIPVSITDATPGQDFFASIETATTPGVQQTLITDINPGPVKRNIMQVSVSCRFEGKAEIRINGTIIGSMRTGGSTPNPSFKWSVPKPYATGETLTVTFKSRTGSPISDVECYVMALDYN